MDHRTRKRLLTCVIAPALIMAITWAVMDAKPPSRIANLSPLHEELNEKIRDIIPTRERALKLFRRTGREDSLERSNAVERVRAALLLPRDLRLVIQMSAPGGSNGGTGHFNVAADDNEFHRIAHVKFQRPDVLFGRYKYGGLRLYPAWTNFNTRKLGLDSKGVVYDPALR